jgi:hypothetical protein
LSQKLDNMLKEAKIDGELMASLGSVLRTEQAFHLQLMLWQVKKNMQA